MDTKGNVILHRKKGWRPNTKVQEWKDKKYEEQQKKKKHQHERRTKSKFFYYPFRVLDLRNYVRKTFGLEATTIETM